MPVYSRGSKGAEVILIQKKLAEMALYAGPIDGDFGKGTERGVKGFQRSKGLTDTGIVDSRTWELLFNGENIAEPAITKESLKYRCLALTGSFETGKPIPDCFAGISGDFDGQGMSFGVLQWNFGQNSLQPLLLQMDRNHNDIMRDVFDEYYATIKIVLESNRKEQMEWVRSIQHPVQNYIYEPWKSLLKTLARTREFQDIQVENATKLYDSAISLCREYELWSERAVSLMFDIKTQNGSIRPITQSLINGDIRNQSLSGIQNEDGEVKKMVIIANRRSEACKPRWIEDVRSRKLTIAMGAGEVHGAPYKIAEQYGIRLRRFEEA